LILPYLIIFVSQFRLAMLEASLCFIQDANCPSDGSTIAVNLLSDAVDTF